MTADTPFLFDPVHDLPRAQLVARIAAGGETAAAAVVVLVGRHTAGTATVIRAIEDAWVAGRPLLGIHVHSLLPEGHADPKGADPFAAAGLADASIPVFDPTCFDWRGHIDAEATHLNLSERLPTWAAQGRSRAV